MRRAKYYVEDLVGREWSSSAFTSKRAAIRNGRFYGVRWARPTRIRYRGRVIAKWVNGQRVRVGR